LEKENIYTIPNFLSLYRLLSFPVLLWLVYGGNENLFAILLCVNLITDVLDGIIARAFNQQTRIGARLDSLADMGTYILAFVGIYAFRMEVMKDDIWLLWAFVGIFVLAYLFSILKFKSTPSLHLYSTKTAGYIQGIFFFVLFIFHYVPWLFFLAMIFGFISMIEEIVILYKLKEMKSNVKGWIWMKEEDYL